MIKNVLFDLDGTLLPMNQDEFVKCYMPLLAKCFVKKGIMPDVTVASVWKGVGAMVQNDGSCTNEECFWECFEKCTGVLRAEVEKETLDFYANEFNQAIVSTKPNPLADRIVKELKKQGIKVYLATNPIFPKIATMNRIKWAGLSVDDFEYITTYETSHYCKPNPRYYKELMEKFHLESKECIMVGNDVEEDLSIRTLGVKTYLVTDCLENKKNLSIDSEYTGSLEKLSEMVRKHELI